MTRAASNLDTVIPSTPRLPIPNQPRGLLSPFQEYPVTMLDHCASRSTPSFSPCLSDLGSLSALSFESCSSTGSISGIASRETRRASTDCDSVDSAALLGFCLCGQSLESTNSEGDEDLAIYCSSACARKDALHALLGSSSSSENAQKDNEYRSSSIRTTSDMPNNHMRSSTLHGSTSFDVQNTGGYYATNHHGNHHALTNASFALQKITKMDTTHYRRMGALRARRDSYPSEVLEDVFLTPMSGNTSLDEQDDRQAVLPENNEETTDATSTSAAERRAQRHIISLPATPSLDCDDNDEGIQRRKRHEEIESELRQLDALLSDQMQSFARQNIEGDGELDEEEDVLMSIASPLLDYEAPLGWRNSTRVYSTNFLGLHLGHDSPSAHSDDSDCAVYEHEDSNARVSIGLQQPALLNEDNKANAKFCPSIYIPTALDLARELAYMQTSCGTEKAGSVTEHSTFERSSDVLSSIAMSRDASSASSASTVVPDEDAVAPLPKVRQRSNTLRTFQSKRNLYQFFSRRPSEPTISATAQGISSADLALTPHLAPRSVPPRFSSLAASVPMRRL